MSFILDALKRAEQERQQDGALSIAIPQPAAPAEEVTDRRALVWLLWIGSTLAVVVLAVWISVTISTRLSIQALSDNPTATVAATETLDIALETAIAAPVRAAHSSVAAEQSRPEAAAPTGDIPLQPELHSEISALYQSTEAAPRETTDAVQSLYQPEQPEQSGQPEQPEPVSTSRQVAKVERPEPSPLVQEILAARIPQIHELPRALQQSIPSIHYRDHQFHDGPDSRVILNGRELGEGAQLDRDLRVDKILADGVVLNFKGQSFKLRAQNSWINM